MRAAIFIAQCVGPGVFGKYDEVNEALILYSMANRELSEETVLGMNDFD